MRWNRAMVQPVLNVRTGMLNDAREDAFRTRYSASSLRTTTRQSQPPRNEPYSFG
jgi:hypothetical protein